MLLILAMGCMVKGNGQSIYKGFTGEYPIELVIDDFYDDEHHDDSIGV